MRRVLSFAVLGLGVFAVAAGLFLRFYAYPTLARIPHNPNTTAVAEGSGITALVYVGGDGGSPATAEIHHNLSLKSTTYVSGDMKAPEVQADGNVTSWIEGTEVVDLSNPKQPISATFRELCLDRYTAEAVAPCTNQYLEKVRGTKVPGATGKPQFPGLNFKFPFQTEKKSYPWYDSSLGKTVDAKFDSEEDIDGVTVYRFTQSVPSTNIDSREVPGSLIGKPDATVKAGLFYEVDRTLWIEPVTGAVINVRQTMKQELRAADDVSGTKVFDGTLQLSKATVDKNVQLAKDNVSMVWFLTGLPVILWIVGGLLTVAGIILVVRMVRSRA